MKKYIKISGLLLLLTFSVYCLATEAGKKTVTDAKQLKGIWEALNLYQETSRQERINTFHPPLPEIKEFESKEEYQDRINSLNEIYERRTETSLKKEISNEQAFKDTIFTLRFTYTPYTSSQDSGYQYLSQAGLTRESAIQSGEQIPDRDFNADIKPVGSTYLKKNNSIDVNIGGNYEIQEKTRVLKKRMGTTGLDTGAAAYNAKLRNTGYPWHNMLVFLKIPGFIVSSPPIYQWMIDENNFSLRENTAYLTFSLGKYDMDKQAFPVILPLPATEKEQVWVYYAKSLIDWRHYTKTFKQVDSQKIEQWTIKFDQLPVLIPFPLEEAKKVRNNAQDLTLEIQFQPVTAKKIVNPDNIQYILTVKFFSARLKDINDTLYLVSEIFNSQN